jgi:hypothetical protein
MMLLFNYNVATSNRKAKNKNNGYKPAKYSALLPRWLIKFFWDNRPCHA